MTLHSHDQRVRACSLGRLVVLCTALLSGCASGAAREARTLPPAASSAAHEFQAGQHFAARGDWVRAEQYFASALRHGYPELRAVSRLLQVCIGASRLRAALGYVELYLLSHPDNWQLRYLSACIHAALEQLPAARRELEQVLHAHATHAPALRLLAELDRVENERSARLPGSFAP